MNETNLTAHYNTLLSAVSAVIGEGIGHARLDDPHRFATISSHFRDGRGRPRLVVEFVSESTVTVGLEFVGMSTEGEETSVQIFGTTLGRQQAEVH